MKKFTLIIASILLFACVTHLVVFRAESNCILVPFHGLKNQNGFYFDKSLTDIEINNIKSLIKQSKVRAKSFWGNIKAKPTIIYCHNEDMFIKYAGALHPATTIMKMEGFIILQKEGLSLDIIAHEFSHAEIYERVGFLNNLKVPLWFHEGLSMQVDYRDEFSIESLKHLSNDLTSLPDINSLISNQQFHTENTILNYAFSKYYVANLLKQKEIDSLLKNYTD